MENTQSTKTAKLKLDFKKVSTQQEEEKLP